MVHFFTEDDSFTIFPFHLYIPTLNFLLLSLDNKYLLNSSFKIINIVFRPYL